LLRRELQHEGHDADVGAEVLHRAGRLGALERGELEHLEALLLRRDLHRIGLAALFFRRDEHPRDAVAAREERVQHRLAEILLTDDGDLHQAAFFGGMEKAPAPLSEPILPSSWPCASLIISLVC